MSRNISLFFLPIWLLSFFVSFFSPGQPAVIAPAFSDVANGYWAYPFIEALYLAGITGGCATNPLRYCPDQTVTRAQMAVFLERGIHGMSFTPDTNTPITFGDTAAHWARYWIESFKADGVTGGCGNGNYCPDSPVTRGQMAVFLLRAKYGSAYTPAPALGTVFADVPASYWSAAWIEQLAVEGITGGCGGGLYCPELAVSRAQMAVFIVKTFNLPMPPSQAGVLISSILYDPYTLNEPEEAFALINLTSQDIDLAGWQATDGEGTVTFPARTLSAGGRIWVTKTATAFRAEFGFQPDFEYGGNSDPTVPDMTGTAPILANAGDELQLLNRSAAVVDTVVYAGGNTGSAGWSGVSVSPYTQGYFAVEGQILYRKLSEVTGLPITDTNTSADWAQTRDDDLQGRKVQYPGWDMEHFFIPFKATQQAHLTYIIGPDHLYEAYIAEINKAAHSIYIEGYTFDHVGIANALAAKLAAGVQVIVLLEGEPVGGIDDQEKWICQQLEGSGGECWFMVSDSATDVHNRYDFQHSKFTVVDGVTLLTGSENLNYTSMPADDKGDGTNGNRGVYLITDSSALIGRALDIFARDLDPTNHEDIHRWNVVTDSPSPGFVPDTTSGGTGYAVQFGVPLALFTTFDFEVVQSPENSLRSSDSLLGMVARAGAGDMLFVEQLYEYKYWGASNSNPVDDPNPRLEAYLSAARRGAQVYLLLDSVFDDPLDTRGNTATCAYVNGIAVAETLSLSCRLGNPTGTGIHNKMVLVWDGAQGWTHTGSINGSENSVKNNRELAIQVRSTEGFNYLSQVFDADWVASGGSPIFGTHPSELLISEFFYDTPGTDSDEEWVEVYNPTFFSVSLTGYKLGDEESPGSSEGMYAFPNGFTLLARQRVVIALKASGFYALYGSKPDFEVIDTDPSVPNMTSYSTWGSGTITLNNTGDEILLLNGMDVVIDVVIYASGAYGSMIAHPGVASGHSLERSPLDQDTDNCVVDFVERFSPIPR